MSKVALTDLSVRALKAPARGQITVWDSISPIGVRVSQGGSKTFIVMTASGQRRSIGRVGIISLADARAEARRILAEKTLGLLKPKASAIRFETALPLFIEENYKGRKPRSKSEANRHLTTHFLPAFRKKTLPEITDGDIGKQLAKLSHVPSEQLHAFRTLRTFFKWCTRPPHRYIAHSPLEGYEPPGRDKKGTRVLADAELVKVWRASAGQYGAMVRLLMLWGTRNGETGRLRRSWIDGDVLTIPGEFTKNKRAHAIPLLPMARAVLNALPDQGDFFFPGRTENVHFNDGSWGKLKIEIATDAGVTDWQLRDIRRTFRSNLSKLRIPREISEILLNHVTGANRNDLDEIYDRYDYMEEKRDALSKWEARLSALLKEAP